MENKNCICEIAKNEGREYMTPEDVEYALELYPEEFVQKCVLEIIGKYTPFGIEDVSLCAFVSLNK